MSKRVKTKTLFNKNHISVIKTENMNNPEEWVRVEGTTTPVQSHYNYRVWNKHQRSITVDIIAESPLGFKYKTTETKYIDITDNDSHKRWDGFKVTIFKKTFKYEITYLTSFEDIEINAERRPWQIHENDKSMPDHFIKDLKKIIDNMLMFIEENKLDIQERWSDYRRNEAKKVSLFELKKKLYVDLFGSEKGIRFQTDEEKILSHGFDTVTSFRNM